MAENQDIERMHELVTRINHASDAYYGKGGEPMSNLEWDKLYDELVTLEKKTGIVMSNSPTVNVGGEDSTDATFEKMEHEISVKSLDKTKDIDALTAFIGTHPGIMSWKLDGLTVVLTYDNGNLIKAVTRGKNGIGELVTENARNFIAGVPHTIPYKGHLNVRGEALITYADFEIVNASLPEGEEPYKNPRNLAAGSVRQANSAEVKNRRVNFIAFSSDHEEVTHDVEFNWLEGQGFLVVPHMVVNNGTTRQIQQEVKVKWRTDLGEAWDVPVAVEMFRSLMPDNQFPTDGLVLQFNETQYGKSLGETNKFPRDAIAFKWQDEEKETTVKEIFWSPSRTGLINPVAVFEPIELEGTTVERASVHNVGILEQLSITPGDTITVYKANMIIPQVSGNKTMLDKPVIPDTCPACGQKTEIRISKEGSKMLYCPNPECSAKHIKRFVHAVKQDALNFVGVSESTLKDFIDRGFLHTLPDLYRLAEHGYQIKEMEGYGEKSMVNILSSMQQSKKNMNLQRLIYACGIEFVGRTASKAICRHFNYDVTRTLNATKEELMEIPDVGEAIANSYVAWFSNQINQEMFEDLLSQVELTVPEIKQVEAAAGKPGINGKTLVITGDVTKFANRNAFKAWVEEHGGKLTGSVSKNTDFLVTNTPNSGTSKNKKAQELGVRIVTEQEIIDMVE